MELLELARKLVAFRTISTSEKPDSTIGIANFISNYCESHGFSIEHYPFSDRGVKMVNVIARKGGQESRLALSGHMDTVNVKTEIDKNKEVKIAGWNTDPFDLAQVNDKIFGRGIADMKLFLAIAIKAGESISAASLKYPFALCFTSTEEIGCLGMKKLERSAVHIADSIVIGEPTEMWPANLHKGYMFLKVRISDRNVEDHRVKEKHSSDPRTACNVVETCMPRILNAISKFKSKLRMITDSRFDPSFATLNVGVVTTGAGASKNIIPGQFEIQLDIRPLPGQDMEELADILGLVISRSVEDIKNIRVKTQAGRGFTLPMQTQANAEIVQCVEKITGQECQGVCFNTEGAITVNKMNAPTIIWGPGSIRQAHKPNEFVDMIYTKKNVVDLYAKSIYDMCC